MTTTLIRDNAIMPVGVPPYCSACGGQDTDVSYVDFDAACDRGYGEDPSNPDVRVAMEYLILCENCVREGARQIGMVEDDQRERIGSLQRRLDEECKRCEQAINYADRMEQALAGRPEKLTVSRPRGRPPKAREMETANA